jgi:hypothetical protein
MTGQEQARRFAPGLIPRKPSFEAISLIARTADALVPRSVPRDAASPFGPHDRTDRHIRSTRQPVVRNADSTLRGLPLASAEARLRRLCRQGASRGYVASQAAQSSSKRPRTVRTAPVSKGVGRDRLSRRRPPLPRMPRTLDLHATHVTELVPIRCGNTKAGSIPDADTPRLVCFADDVVDARREAEPRREPQSRHGVPSPCVAPSRPRFCRSTRVRTPQINRARARRSSSEPTSTSRTATTRD